MKYARQEGIRDCGICCLYNIIKFYNGNIDLEKLRDLTNTNENGTSIYNLVKTSNMLGFKSKAYRCEINDLGSLEFPLIAFIKLNEFNHFVIIDDIDIDKVKIFDPIRGYLNYSLDEFLNEWQNIIITFERNGEIVKEKSYYYNFIYNIVNNNKNKIIMLCILSILCTIFGMSLSVFFKRLFDNKMKNNTFLLFIFLLVIKEASDFIRGEISIRLNNKVDYDLSSKVYEKIYSLPKKYHHNRPIGDISSRINDLYSVKDFITTFTLTTFIDILLIIVISFIFLFKNLSIFFLSFFISVTYIIIYLFYRNDEKRLLENLKNCNAHNNSLLIDNLNGIETIKNLNIEEKIIKKQKESLISSIKTTHKFHLFLLKEETFLSFIETLGILLMMFKGYKLINENILSVGDLTYMYTLFITMFSSIKSLLNFDRNIIISELSYKRINSFLNTPKDIAKGKIIKDISNISFENSLIKNSKMAKFNLEINKGDFILISGKSGIGKSSLFKSLLKEEKLDEGCIKINGIDVNNIKESSIKKNICYISQNEYIFNDTIKNNILMYKNVNSKELEKVLKVTLLDKLLKKKNINLDYLLEENASNISGGERQKILLARALLSNANFIVLDETMNELDIDNERKILKNINTEYKKTLILITHRDSNKDLFNKRVLIE